MVSCFDLVGMCCMAKVNASIVTAMVNVIVVVTGIDIVENTSGELWQLFLMHKESVERIVN